MFRRCVARFLAVVLSVVAPGLMVLPSAAAEPVVEGVVIFADVPESSLFYKEISWLAAKGISTGWDVGGGVRVYRPLDSIARDAMAAFLYRKAGSPAYTPPDSSPFTDVAPGAAFYKEITWLSSQGISTGWDVGGGKREYRPLNPIARDAMAAFLYRFAKPGEFSAPAQSPFVDLPAGAAFYREITWLASSGISTGWEIGGGLREYRPLSGIARDAMAAFLYRYASEKVLTNPLDPAAGTVTVAPDVEVLDAAQLDTALVSGGTLTLPSNEADEINPNDVLVAGVTTGTPEGLLARVVQVSRDPGGNTVVKLKPATLTEAIVSTSGLLEVAGTPASSTFTPEPDVAVTTDAAPQMVQPEALTTGEVFSESFSLKKTIKPTEIATDGLRGSGLVTLESSIRTSAKAKMTLEAGFLQLKEASLVLTPSFLSKHSVSVSGTLEGTASVKLGVLKAVIVFPTPVPVVVTAEAEVAVNLSAAGTAEISYVTAHTVSSDIGFKHRDGTFNLVNTKPLVTGAQNDVKATASLTARLALDFNADIRFYGIAGITFGAGPYASAPIAVTSSNGTQTWSCPLEIGFEGRLGVVAGIEVMGFKLENRNGTSAAWKLLEANPCEGTSVIAPNGTGALAIQTVLLPRASVGQTYNAVLEATGGVSPYAWAVSSGALPGGLALDAGTGRISGAPVQAGVGNFSILVSDRAGAKHERSFTLSVSAAGDGTIRELVAGAYSAYAIKNDGTVSSWGLNSYGMLGNGNTVSSSTPVQVSGLTGVESITHGWGAVYAVKTDGTVSAWGANFNGELGDGTITASSVPVLVRGLTGVRNVVGAGSFALAIKADGTVWSWGNNTYGQLGNGTKTHSAVPVRVAGLTDVQLVAAHQTNSFAVKSDGTVWAWGGDYYSQLGNGTNGESSVPVQVGGLTDVTELCTPGNTVFAVKRDGTVWSWGDNVQGELGHGTPGTRSDVPQQVVGLTGVRNIVCRSGMTTALKVDGTVWTWGHNDKGELGNGTTVRSLVPVQVQGLVDVQDIVGAGFSSSVFALKTDGTTWAWGENTFGILGNGTSADASIPVRTNLPAGAIGITAGNRSAYALMADGTAGAWGENYHGQLGNGSTAHSSVPVRVGL